MSRPDVRAFSGLPAIHAWLLLLPAMVLLVAFTHYPTLQTLVDSFRNTPRGGQAAVWVGLEVAAGGVVGAVSVAEVGAVDVMAADPAFPGDVVGEAVEVSSLVTAVGAPAAPSARAFVVGPDELHAASDAVSPTQSSTRGRVTVMRRS